MKNIKTVCMTMVTLTALSSGVAHAGMVTNTDDFAQHTPHATVTVSEVMQVLDARGVATDNLQARLERMSPSELAQLHNEFEQLPAGAGVDTITGVLIGAAFLVMSDYMGFTDIFPFIKADQDSKD